jgi:plasmid stability protein
MQNACKQASAMAASIQIRNVPDELHRTLKARAAMAGMSLSDYLMDYMRRLASRPTPQEMRERLSRREPVRVSEPAADVLRRERDGTGPEDEPHRT